MVYIIREFSQSCNLKQERGLLARSIHDLISVTGQGKGAANTRLQSSERALALERVKGQQASRRIDELQEQVQYLSVVLSRLRLREPCMHVLSFLFLYRLRA